MDGLLSGDRGSVSGVLVCWSLDLSSTPHGSLSFSFPIDLSMLTSKLNTSLPDVQRRDLRDLKGRGPWAVASERSEDATKGPRPFKSRRSLRCTSNLFRFARRKFIGR